MTDIPKPGMFISKMPRMAIPRRLSRITRRSVSTTGAAVIRGIEETGLLRSISIKYNGKSSTYLRSVQADKKIPLYFKILKIAMNNNLYQCVWINFDEVIADEVIALLIKKLWVEA
jgi:hypothetical protein